MKSGSELLKPFFDADVRSRGRDYFEAGRVKIKSADPSMINATVKGTRSYRVEIEIWDDDDYREVIAYCSCPYFEDHDSCKHIWATILQAEHDGQLDLPDDGQRLVVNDLVTPAASAKSAPPPPPSWEKALFNAAGGNAYPVFAAMQIRAAPKEQVEGEVRYEIPVDDVYSAGRLVIQARIRTQKKNGEWSVWKDLATQAQLESAPTQDRILALALKSAEGYFSYSSFDSGALPIDTLAPTVADTGRLFAIRGKDEFGPIRWDSGDPWSVEMEIAAAPDGKSYRPAGWLTRGEEREPISKPLVLLAGGWIVWPDRISRLNTSCAFSWISMLRSSKPPLIPVEEGPKVIEVLSQYAAVPKVVLPEELRMNYITVDPKPCLAIGSPTNYNRRLVSGRFFFDYDGQQVNAGEQRMAIVDAEQKRMLARNMDAENDAAEDLDEVGVMPAPPYQLDGNCCVDAEKLGEVVRTLAPRGWTITASGQKWRLPGKFDMAVESGIDWFDVRATCTYDEQAVSLPRLLEALKNKQTWVQLDDGSVGLLPEKWLEQFGVYPALGEARDDVVRFRRSQASLLDAWLESMPEARVDEVFTRVRSELRRFDHVTPEDEPAGFKGTLRPYQKEGLGWLKFLRQFGFGGCLADDMGLGKTVQVLALLQSHILACKKEDKPKAPSLIVAPRSLIFNWLREAAQFAPKLRILDHTGSDRAELPDGFRKTDVVLTTYGTMRSDIGWLKNVSFDYVILDESQAVKNTRALATKAVRLLKGNHRLALSGTPIENHLGELWSLMEFLNPGLLGTLAGFDRKLEREADTDTRTALARAVRPFILRRTKQQVAKDLPARQEETLYCELPPEQRKLYDELKEHYRASLLGKISEKGLARSKMHVLEALLRLRQAACHPGLLGEKHAKTPCAKFETLIPQLEDVVEEGHKALVFSQFTQLLGILRGHLDKSKTTYEYLDGKTRDRQARVDRFQTDAKCPLFLISLKAGGLGLNLTAADYVFLLDPWWNPAVEAQAIDRAHRIGQTSKVFAYRLIAKNTVEEKILELQKSKRDLADAIIGEDNSIIRNLTRDDLEFLLG